MGDSSTSDDSLRTDAGVVGAEGSCLECERLSIAVRGSDIDWPEVDVVRS